MEEGPESAAEVYDTNRFSDLYHASRRPSPQHLGLAARFLIALFGSHSVFYAFLGGWAVYLRGGGRRTEDVDVSVATSMESLTAILLLEERCDRAPCSYSISLLSFSLFPCSRFGSINFSGCRSIHPHFPAFIHPTVTLHTFDKPSRSTAYLVVAM